MRSERWSNYGKPNGLKLVNGKCAHTCVNVSGSLSSFFFTANLTLDCARSPCIRKNEGCHKQLTLILITSDSTSCPEDSLVIFLLNTYDWMSQFLPGFITLVV